jgi:hypothetical protein
MLRGKIEKGCSFYIFTIFTANEEQDNEEKEKEEEE